MSEVIFIYLSCFRLLYKAASQHRIFPFFLWTGMLNLLLNFITEWMWNAYGLKKWKIWVKNSCQLVILKVCRNQGVSLLNLLHYIKAILIYKQSLTFVHNSFLQTCTKVKMYESWAIDLYFIRGLLSWCLNLKRWGMFWNSFWKHRAVNWTEADFNDEKKCLLMASY